MATHGYIKVEKEGKDSVIIHAFHDGYTDNMLRDILEVPMFIVKFLKTSEKNSYVLNMFNRDKEETVKGGFDRLRRLWDSIIPLKSIDDTFSSWLIASDPMMYIHCDEDIKKGDINMKFTDKRLASCDISLNREYDDDVEAEYDDYVSIINKTIYLEDNKIKKIKSESGEFKYHMNINFIVLDYLWQEMDPSIKRDKRLEEILKTA